jgi:hypothetical protein
MQLNSSLKVRYLAATFTLLAVVALAAGTALIRSSSSAERFGKASSRLNSASAAAKALSVSPTEACGTTSWSLTAGQTIDVGTVTVSNDANNLYVKYTLDDPDYPNACFGDLHVWVGNDLTNLPSTPGNDKCPIPGQFCSADGGACVDASGLKTYTFTIPFAELNIVDVNEVCNLPLYVVTHAEVDLDCTDGDTGHETAFGGPTPGNCNRWYFYGIYNVCCDSGPPPTPTCETAFAKGGWVWTTDRKSNPQSLPSLRLTRNRWGWAINLTAPGVTTYEIWAGAGLNNTGNGEKVGTLMVNWNGANAIVTYTMNSGCDLEEVHLYASDARPTTTAPGQYGNLAQFDPNATTYTFNVPLADSNGTDGVWLIAHAVVCCNPQ